jgi:pyruvate formate-lyase/glycerol dehydratase family glycyl radical enzyme
MVAQAIPPETKRRKGTAAELAVLNVQRTCVHDGPGIRTVIFFRGCKLRCKWCHNPEAQAFARREERGALWPVSDLMRAVNKDREYYRSTHGGVTLSGGEPLLQPQADLLPLLEALKGEEIQVAVETAGDVPWKAFEATLPYVDLYLFDLKAVGDDELHVQLTGRHLHTVEQNVKSLCGTGAKVTFRMCVVPGCNDSPANLEATAKLLKSVAHPAIELLRYYNLHESKARRLGLSQEPLHISNERSLEALERAAKAFAGLGIEVAQASLEAARHAAEFSPRVGELASAIRNSGYSVCIETAKLKTDFYKKHGFKESTKTHRAKLLRYILNNKTITVYPNELLVGNYTSKRVGGNIWVEYFGTAVASILWRIERQTPVSFQCSTADKLRFYFGILPFWARHGLFVKLFPSAEELGLFAARMVERKAGFNNNLAAIAHYIVNSERMLKLGTSGIAEEVKAKRAESRGAAADFYEGVLIALKGLEEFAGRYAARLEELGLAEADTTRRAELSQMAQACRHVPKYPARTFAEALQCILFLHIALCTESFENAISFGRLDQILYPYYQADVAAGRLDYARAQELVACFVLKLEEVILINDGDSGLQLSRMFETVSTDEALTIGGVDPDGRDATNEVTYLFLDACELRPIGINMTARIHRGSPAKYVERIAEVYLNGSPMPALYNDDIYTATLQQHYGVSLPEARNYAIVGCVEPNASNDHFGNTDCANVNVTLPLLQALWGDERPLWKKGELDQLGQKALRFARRKASSRTPEPEAHALGALSFAPYCPPKSMDEIMARYQARMNELVAAILADHARIEKALAAHLTTPLCSSLYEGCIATGRDIYEGGASINTSGIQAVGITDAADSLLAIDEVVYQKKLFTLDEIVGALDADFQGEHNQKVRQVLLDAPKFGDDSSAEPAAWVNRVLGVYVKALAAVKHEPRNGRYTAGYYGLNVNRVYGLKTPALPSGRLSGVPLANSVCPHYGMQQVDLTSSLNAVSQVSFAAYAPNGTTLTSTIDAGLFPGERGTRNLAGLIQGYFRQGGMQFQPNLVSRETLLDAYHHPEKYKNLIVRIAGYCAYFNELSDELKKEIIDRTYYSDALRA